jgi:hypothetical protein
MDLGVAAMGVQGCGVGLATRPTIDPKPESTRRLGRGEAREDLGAGTKLENRAARTELGISGGVQRDSACKATTDRRSLVAGFMSCRKSLELWVGQ